MPPDALGLLSRGDLAGFIRGLHGRAAALSPGECQAKFSVALSNLARTGDVASARRMSESAAEALLDSPGVLGGHQVLLLLVEMLISTGAREWPATAPIVQRILARLAGGWSDEAAVAAVLVGPSHRWGLPSRAAAGSRLAGVWARWVSGQPKLLTTDLDAEALDQHVRRLFAEAAAEPASPPSAALAESLLTLPLYFRDAPVLETMRHRAALVEHLARRHLRDDWWPLSTRRAGRLRVGVVAWDFAARTETYTTYPVFSHLPPGDFDVRLYAISPQQSVLPKSAPAIRALPQDLARAAATVRDDDLDLLVVGTNVTVTAHLLATLATCRLARRTITFFSSPVTTGYPSVSDYVSGELAEAHGAQADYTETLRLLPGAGYCSGHRLLSPPAAATVERGRLGLTPTGVVFSSGAVVHKLSPALRRAWARILAAVPGSQLLLLPFAPTWDSQWPVLLLRDLFAADFAEHGVDPSRLRLVGSLPNREQVVAVLRASDVYLDSFPYTGANSVMDALEASLPAVVLEGRQMRCRQAAALLRAAGLEELVASSADVYVALATRLGSDHAARRSVAERVRAAVSGSPVFLNPAEYSSQCAALFQQLCASAD